ncbi:lysophospholipid acyltransferase family protein [Thalassovita aquimarina]|uniref:Lysophospholipid acyltransferase family protein n=1 Tax=Thalassovita aquimarina TaxID=2785917 RepID=A0ABS5HS65_9RHOB|nr:lysophospholipid acyltransferase family protein [Thalassovita aquimarina]MBR9651749.1 lysophospholipid acyltransferase family protein [Thalassovita aquimarina]
MSTQKLSFAARAGQYALNLVMSAPLFLTLALPYRWRVPMMGWLLARVIAPLAGYDKRVRQNLALVWPDLPQSEVDRLARAVPDNFGRTLIEVYSGEALRRHVAGTKLEGPGAAALEEACKAGRPVMMVSGHFGNHDAVRAMLAQKYGNISGLYRPLDNIYFDRHWVRALNAISSPVYPRTRRGLAELVKFLRQGNIVAFLMDQHVAEGARLTFFGHPAMTSLSAAELALKYDALFLPAFGIRNEDGISFTAYIDTPIPHSSAEEMTQQFNDRLEAMIRQHPDQWFWIHRRWKAKP